MKNFDDMGILEMAKTLGDLGDELRKDYHDTAVGCINVEDQYEKEIRRLNEIIKAQLTTLKWIAQRITNETPRFYPSDLATIQQAIAKAEGE